MNRIKVEVSRQLKIGTERLNEISLEDIELMDGAQQDLQRAVSDIIATTEFGARPETLSPFFDRLMPCTSYWVEGTRELVLYVWNQCLGKTVVVAEGSWAVRKDIVVH